MTTSRPSPALPIPATRSSRRIPLPCRPSGPPSRSVFRTRTKSSSVHLCQFHIVEEERITSFRHLESMTVGLVGNISRTSGLVEQSIRLSLPDRLRTHRGFGLPWSQWQQIAALQASIICSSLILSMTPSEFATTGADGPPPKPSNQDVTDTEEPIKGTKSVDFNTDVVGCSRSGVTDQRNVSDQRIRSTDVQVSRLTQLSYARPLNSIPLFSSPYRVRIDSRMSLFDSRVPSLIRSVPPIGIIIHVDNQVVQQLICNSATLTIDQNIGTN